MNDLPYPRGEIVWEKITEVENGTIYIITSKQIRDYYYIYKFENGNLVKLGKDRNPKSLKEKYIGW